MSHHGLSGSTPHYVRTDGGPGSRRRSSPSAAVHTVENDVYRYASTQDHHRSSRIVAVGREVVSSWALSSRALQLHPTAVPWPVRRRSSSSTVAPCTSPADPQRCVTQTDCMWRARLYRLHILGVACAGRPVWAGLVLIVVRRSYGTDLRWPVPLRARSVWHALGTLGESTSRRRSEQIRRR